MIYVVADRPQVEARYGQAGAMDIFDNTGAEIVFGTNDLKTTEEVSQRIGDNTTSAITKQRPRMFPAFQWNKQSEAEHLHRRPMMLPQEVARMGNDQQIILRAGMQACVTDRQGWFNDPALVALHCPPPVIPRIPLPVATDDGQTRIVRPKPRNISWRDGAGRRASGDRRMRLIGYFLLFLCLGAAQLPRVPPAMRIMLAGVAGPWRAGAVLRTARRAWWEAVVLNSRSEHASQRGPDRCERRYDGSRAKAVMCRATPASCLNHT